MNILAHGDSLEMLKVLDENSVDSVVCDPPYELNFMNKGWDASGIANNKELWKLVLRVLKPGGHLLAFGGTRTFHRMTCAIEDAGFEIRDCMSWLYGSGFPKSQDVSKAIDKQAGAVRDVVSFNSAAYAKRNQRRAIADEHAFNGGFNDSDNGATITAPSTDGAKQWNGWGTALKPAWESIILAQKPIDLYTYCGIMAHKIGEILCQLPSYVRAAEKHLTSNQKESVGDVDSALWISNSP